MGLPFLPYVENMASECLHFTDGKDNTAGMTLSEAQCLKHLEKENQKLKILVAKLSLDKVMRQDVLAKKAKSIGVQILK